MYIVYFVGQYNDGLKGMVYCDSDVVYLKSCFTLIEKGGGERETLASSVKGSQKGYK